MVKIYQQIDSQLFHIGTSANEEWFLNDMGALDVDAPEYDKVTEKAKWNKDKQEWVIKTIEDWEAAKDYRQGLLDVPQQESFPQS